MEAPRAKESPSSLRATMTFGTISAVNPIASMAQAAPSKREVR